MLNLDISGGKRVQVTRDPTRPVMSEVVLVRGMVMPDGSVKEEEIFPLTMDFGKWFSLSGSIS